MFVCFAHLRTVAHPFTNSLCFNLPLLLAVSQRRAEVEIISIKPRSCTKPVEETFFEIRLGAVTSAPAPLTLSQAKQLLDVDFYIMDLHECGFYVILLTGSL